MVPNGAGGWYELVAISTNVGMYQQVALELARLSINKPGVFG